MTSTVAVHDKAPRSEPELTWKLVHAEPGALVFAIPGLKPTHPLVRRTAGTTGWVPAGVPSRPHPGGPTPHSALHYAEYIGRIGVLAAALGVGAAVASTPATAWAEPADTDTDTSTSSSSTSAPAEAGSTETRPDASTGGAQTPETSEDSGTPTRAFDVAEPPSSETSTTVSAPGAPKVTISSSGGALTSTTEPREEVAEAPTAIEPEVEPALEPEATEPVLEPAESLVEPAAQAETAAPTAAAEAAPAEPAAETALAPEGIAPTEGPAAKQSESGSDRMTTSAPSTAPASTKLSTPMLRVAPPLRESPADATAPVVETTLAEAQPVATALVSAPVPAQTTVQPAAPVSLVNRVLSAVISPFSPAGATTPAAQTAQTTITWGVLGWVRRTFFNQTPTVSAPTETTQVDATITGTIIASDTDGPAPVLTASTSAEGGAVTIEPDGTFTYTVPDSLAETGGTDSFTVTASDAASGFHIHGFSGFLNAITFGLIGEDGHSATTTVYLDVKPVNAAPIVGDPTFTVTGVDPDTGAITGTLNVTDPDDDDVDYTLVEGPDPLEATLDFNTETGQFTLTPTPRARVAAYGTEGPDTAGFTVTATDGTHTTDPFTAAPEIDPTQAVPITELPAGYQLHAGVNVRFGPDGTAYQTIYNSTTTQTAVLVISPTGTATITDAYSGYPLNNVVIVGADGTAAQTIQNGSETTVLVIRPTGTTATTVAGIPNRQPVVGADGTVAQIIRDSTYTQTTMLVVHPDGTTDMPNLVTGIPYSSTVIGTDGTAAQTIFNGNQMTVVVVHPEGATTTTNPTLCDPSVGSYPVVGPDGTTYQTIRTGQTKVLLINPEGAITTTTAVPGDPYGQMLVGPLGAYQTVRNAGQTTVLIVPPDGAATTTGFYAGNPSHPLVMGPNGTAAEAISNAGQTTVLVIHPDGTTDTFTVPGDARGETAVGPTGTVYQDILNAYQTTVAVVRPDGTHENIGPVAGTSYGVVTGSDGTAALTIRNYTGSAVETTVLVIHPDGAITVPDPGAGEPYGLAVVGPDGTAGQTIDKDAVQTTVVVVHPSGDISKESIPGRAQGRVAVGPDGTAYQTVLNYNPTQTTLLTISPAGGISTSTSPGWGYPVVAGPDGTAYQTIDYADQVTVLVSGPTGVTSTTLPGVSQGPVAVGPDGSAYQMVYDPNSGRMVQWLVGASPVPDQALASPASLPYAVNHSTGAVSGSLHVANPYHDTLTYTVAGGPAGGTVTITPDGTFTYTPTPQARRDATTEGTAPADLRDYFTVSVGDEHGGSTIVPVWVVIDPSASPPARTLALSGADGKVMNASVAVTDHDTDPVTYLVIHDPSFGVAPRLSGAQSA